MTNGLIRLLGLICIVGRSGCGKSTILELLTHILSPSSNSSEVIASLEMSSAFTEASKGKDSLASRVQQAAEDRRQGLQINDRLANDVFLWKINRLKQEKPHLRSLVASGFPRSEAQTDLLKGNKSLILVHMPVTEDISYASIYNRWMNTPTHARRPDDPESEDDLQGLFYNRESEYIHNALPAVKLMEKQRVEVVTLSRRDSIQEQLRQILLSMRQMKSPPVPTQVIVKAMRRLDNQSHPVHDMIEKIINPRTDNSTRVRSGQSLSRFRLATA